MQDGIGGNDRRVGHVEAAQIEHPGDRVRLRQHHGVVAANRLRHIFQLVGGTASGELRGLGGDRRRGPCRLVLPHRINGVRRDRHQSRAHLGAGLGKTSGFAGRHQPWIEAQCVALFEIPGDPCGRRLLGQVLGLEILHIHLLAHLNGVAAIDENRRLFRGNNSEAPRAGKACQPFQPLGIGRDILALEFILARNDEPGKLALLQFSAEEGEGRGGEGFLGDHPRLVAANRSGVKGLHLHLDAAFDLGGDGALCGDVGHHVIGHQLGIAHAEQRLAALQHRVAVAAAIHVIVGGRACRSPPCRAACRRS